MALSYTTYFSGSRLTESLCVLYDEIIACQGMRCWDGTVFVVTNLGEIGDARHQAEPTSRHNPMACPDGVWRICACDYGGLFNAYTKISLLWQALYKAGDDRVARFGFCQFGDGTGLEWGTGNRKWTGRDQGHSHIDVNMADSSLANYSSFVPSMVSRRPWGLASFLATGRVGGATITTPPNDSIPEDAMTAADVKAINDHTDDMARANILSLVMPQLLKQGNRFFTIQGDPESMWYDRGDGTRQLVTAPIWAEFGKPTPTLVSAANPLATLRPVGRQPGDRFVLFPGDTSTPDAHLRVYQVSGTAPNGQKLAAGQRYWISAAEYAALLQPAFETLPTTDPLAKASTVNVKVTS